MKVLPSQAWRPELHPQNLLEESWLWWYTCVLPVLGRLRQEDAWGLLSSQPSLTKKLQANEKPCLRRRLAPEE